MEKKIETNYAKFNFKDLEKELLLKIKELEVLRKSQCLKKLDNYYTIVRVKKDIARLNTFLCQKKD